MPSHNPIASPVQQIPAHYADPSPSPADLAQAAIDEEEGFGAIEPTLTFAQAAQLLTRALTWILKGRSCRSRNMRLEIVAYMLRPDAPGAKRYSDIARENGVKLPRITELARSFEAYYGVILHRDKSGEVTRPSAAKMAEGDENDSNIVEFPSVDSTRLIKIVDEVARQVRVAVERGCTTTRDITAYISSKQACSRRTIFLALIAAVKAGYVTNPRYGLYSLPSMSALAA